MQCKSFSIAFASFERKAYDGLIRHIQTLQMTVPCELDRQKKKNKQTNRKNAWSKVTHASHANIVNFHARGLRTPRATRARKLTLVCALLLLLLLAHRIIKKKVLIHTLEKVSLHSMGSFINHIVSNFPIRVISAEIVIDIYCHRAELSWLMTLLIAFLISQ